MCMCVKYFVTSNLRRSSTIKKKKKKKEIRLGQEGKWSEFSPRPLKPQARSGIEISEHRPLKRVSRGIGERRDLNCWWERDSEIMLRLGEAGNFLDKTHLPEEKVKKG